MRAVLAFAVMAVSLPGPTVGQTVACPPMDSTAPWALVSRAWSTESPRGWSNDTLRKALIALVARDQALRADFGRRNTDTAYVRALVKADSMLAAEARAVLDRVGLPTRSMVGAKGSDAFMLVVQHNASLQERVLALAKAVPAGEISPTALAMLEDRVLSARGSPQRFGTNFTMTSDGRFRFDSTADLAGLAARRDRAGLPPLDLYVCLMESGGMRIDRSSLPKVPPGPTT